MSDRVSLALLPKDCGKFLTCNASICPLDPLWPTAVHLPGEKICHYLLASGKVGAAEHYGDDAVFAACVRQLPQVTTRHPAVARGIDRAANRPFKAGRPANLRQAKAFPGVTYPADLPLAGSLPPSALTTA